MSHSMQFYDEVEIHIESGKGWNWLVSGRREAKMAFGWPNWGDGGKGWDIVFVASKDENTLLPYKFKKIFKAQSWEDGRTKDQYWSNGESLFLKVPVWTVIKDKSGKIIKQFSHDWEKWIWLKWWEWWKWNIHFKDAVNQYPTFALLWEPARKQDIVLELQLLADVALIGTPSVWKSSLINSVSNTKAKVWDYPFTTLIPNLGSIIVWNYHFNMIDIPGLIKWAAEWKWLWNDFLRHILKARIFCFIADLEKLDSWLYEVSELLDEIIKYIHEKVDENIVITLEDRDDELVLLAKKDDEIVLFKKIIFAMNKYDLINDDEIVWEYKKQFLKIFNEYTSKELNFELKKDTFEKNCFVVSAASHYWLDNWLQRLTHILSKSTAADFNLDTVEEWEFEDEYHIMVKDITDQEKEKLVQEWYIEEMDAKYCKIREIRDPEICKRVFITQWWNDEWENYFWKMMDELGIITEFEESNIKKWDILKIKSYYEWEDDRYILY